MDANKLTIHYDPKKSCWSIFKSLSLPLNYNGDLPVGANEIKCQQTFKYLGIILDDKFNWKSHITEVNTKITKRIGIFGKVPKECLIALYCAFIYSRINYGIEIYTQTTAKPIKLTQIPQNKVLR